MGTMQYRFPSEDAARKFVKFLCWQFVDVACYRDGPRVWVVDGTRIRSRDILHAATALFCGHAE